MVDLCLVSRKLHGDLQTAYTFTLKPVIVLLTGDEIVNYDENAKHKFGRPDNANDFGRRETYTV